MIAEHCHLTWECRPAAEVVATDVAAMVEARFETFLRSLGKGTPEGTVRTDLLVAVPPPRDARFAGRISGAATYRT